MVSLRGVVVSGRTTFHFLTFVFACYAHRGFRPDTRCGGDLGAFTHPLFRRDQPELCLEMACDRLGIAGKKIPAMKTAATAGKPKSKHSVTPVKTQSPKPIKHKRKASGRQQTRNAVASTSRSVEPCPSKSTKPVSVCDDSDDAQSIATSITRMSTVARPLAVLAPTPAFPIAVGAGMPAILTTANAAAAIVQHNTTLTQEALARRNQADRLEVARLMLLHNYLTALSEQLPK
jgi:hypothetical protein